MKRDDLQCIRGIAILSVLFFHFFPSRFPNGFVGVDQFFVLSGFLMMMIFGSKSIDYQSTRQFYYRRIKRIVPLYMIVILAVCVSVYFVFPNTFIAINMHAGLAAALFYTNMARHSAENEYFVQLEQASDLFTHTWSLACEIQFYLIAPLYFLCLRKLSNASKLLSWLYLSSTWILSLTLQLYAQPSTAFNNMFCRMWQFETGIIAFLICEWSQKPSEKSYRPLPIKTNDTVDKEPLISEDSDEEDIIVIEKDVQIQHSSMCRSPCCNLLFSLQTNVLILILLLFTFSNYSMSAQNIRVIVTVLTGLIIVFVPLTEYHPMNNRHMVYLGDVSYCLYLVHWPIYCFVKYYWKDDISVYILGIVCSYVLATIIYENFEKFYLSLDYIGITLMIAVFYIVTLTIVVFSPHFQKIIESLDGNGVDNYVRYPKNMTNEESIRINTLFDRNEYKYLVIPNCYPNTSEHGYCEFQDKQFGTKANLSILVLGNSYAANTGEVINRHFAPFARKLAKFSRSRCEVLILNTNGCWGPHKDYLNITEHYLPDVLFIIARNYEMLDRPFSGPVESDIFLKEAYANLQSYEKWAKKIFILSSFASGTNHLIKDVNQLIANKETIDGDKLVSNENYRNGQKRIEQLVKMCKKCELISYDSQLLDKKGHRLLVDPNNKLSYLTSGAHLTFAGIDRIEPVYASLAQHFDPS